MPTLSDIVDIGASTLNITCNEFDPRLFLQLPISVPKLPHATFTPKFLIDSGATHNVLSEAYARTHSLLSYAHPTHRAIYGFDGSICPASFELPAILASDNTPPP